MQSVQFFFFFFFFQELFDCYNISYTDFIRTTEERHRHAVYKIWVSSYIIAKNDLLYTCCHTLECIHCSLSSLVCLKGQFATLQMFWSWSEDRHVPVRKSEKLYF